MQGNMVKTASRVKSAKTMKSDHPQVTLFTCHRWNSCGWRTMTVLNVHFFWCKVGCRCLKWSSPISPHHHKGPSARTWWRRNLRSSPREQWQKLTWFYRFFLGPRAEFDVNSPLDHAKIRKQAVFTLVAGPTPLGRSKELLFRNCVQPCNFPSSCD